MDTTLTALLCSCDPQTLSIARQTLQQNGIKTTTFRSSGMALQALKRQRFDLFALDFDLRGVESLFEAQLPSGPNAPGVTIGFCETTQAPHESLRKRVRHWMQKPLTVNLMMDAVKTAQGLIVMEKRACFRQAVRIDVLADYSENLERKPLQNTSMLDVSQGGLCLKTDTAVPVHATVFVDFRLPETDDTLHVVGQVRWKGSRGQMGVQFLSISTHHLRVLRNWLNERCPWVPSKSFVASAFTDGGSFPMGYELGDGRPSPRYSAALRAALETRPSRSLGN
jgi:response regulator RpfG family c-di-GMP phosphodiesterase